MKITHVDASVHKKALEAAQEYTLPVVMITRDLCYIPKSSSYTHELTGADSNGFYKYSDLQHSSDMVTYRVHQRKIEVDEYYLIDSNNGMRLSTCSKDQYDLLKGIQPRVVERVTGDDVEYRDDVRRLIPKIIGTYHLFDATDNFEPRVAFGDDYIPQVIGVCVASNLVYSIYNELNLNFGISGYGAKLEYKVYDLNKFKMLITKRLKSYGKKHDVIINKVYTHNDLEILFEQYLDKHDTLDGFASARDVIFSVNDLPEKFDIHRFLNDMASKKVIENVTWGEYK